MKSLNRTKRFLSFRLLAKSILLFLLVTLALFIILPSAIFQLSNGLLSFEIGAFSLLGSLPLALGLALTLWSVLSFAFIGKGTLAPFDPPKKLVITGPYQYVRNPMYLGVTTVVAGEGLFLQSGAIFLQAIAMWLVFHLYVLYFEESALQKRFGQDYEDYWVAVPRWIPKIAF